MVLSPRRCLRRASRRLIERAITPYGFELTRAGAHTTRNGSTDDFELIPRRRLEPFSTADYDIVPRGRYDVVESNYYSPIPDLDSVPEDAWTRRSALAGLELDVERGLEFLQRELAGYVAELDVPVADPGEPGIFYLNNTGFESVDAELLYAMVRRLHPKRVVELGSGYTTLLIGMAARRNGGDGLPTRHVAYDPYPRAHVLGEWLAPPSQLEPISATDVPLDVFTALGPDDVLFVDTTHTVKIASDVNFIVLDVLPRLRAGVVVHFHDIFLPWEYPRSWVEDAHRYWCEQYLLQAFLAFNSGFEVILPAQAIARDYPDDLARVVPSFGPGVSPGSMWLRRRSDPDEDGLTPFAALRENDL